MRVPENDRQCGNQLFPATASLSELSEWLSISTRAMGRFCDEGVRLSNGHQLKLEHCWVGGQRRSSREFVLAFLRRINEDKCVDVSALIGIGIDEE